jgi:hypothetical protein
MSILSSKFSTVFNALTTSGVASNAAMSLLKSLAGNTQLKATLTAQVNQLVANESNAAALQKLAIDIETTPGCPTAIVGLANAVAAPGLTAPQFMQIVEQMETEIGKL